MLRKGALIDKLSLVTEIYKPTTIKNELGSNETTMVKSEDVKMYITSEENSGDRRVVVEKFAETRKYLGQTTAKGLDISINDILKQGNEAYRVLEIDNNAANVNIEAEYTLERISNLQDLQL